MNPSSTNNSQVFKQQVSFAMRLCELKEYSQAESFLRSLLQQQPKNSQIWYLLSYVAARQKQLSKAADLARKAIKLNPQRISYYSTLANIYINQKQFTSAIECYQTAITIEPENANLYQNLGFIYGIEGDIAAASLNYGIAQQLQQNFSEAIKYYQKAIKVQPNYLKAYHCLGNLYRKTEDYDRAIECYQKMIQCDRENAEAHYDLGLVYQERGFFARAIYNYEQAIRYKPDYGDAHLNLSVLYKKQGKLNKAFEACQKAIQYQAQVATSSAPLGRIIEKVSPSENTSPQQEVTKSKLESLQEQSTIAIPNRVREIATIRETTSENNSKNLDNRLETTSLTTKSNKQPATPVNETEQLAENTELVREDRFVYNYKPIFKSIEKKLVAQRILNNNYNFVLITFFTKPFLKNILSLQRPLSQTKLSYSLYQIPTTNLNFTNKKAININYTKPSIFDSIYNTLLAKNNYNRDTNFTHILYVDFRLLFILEPIIIDFFKKVCDRNIDFALYNGLQLESVKAIANLQIEPNFLASSDAIQIYSLSEKTLLIWQVWQETIINYLANFDASKYQLCPGDECFLDYAWNKTLRHNSEIKYLWLEQQLNYYWTPLTRTLIS
jgi:tetratricopeptide (TPR) repeat protein